MKLHFVVWQKQIQDFFFELVIVFKIVSERSKKLIDLSTLRLSNYNHCEEMNWFRLKSLTLVSSNDLLKNKGKTCSNGHDNFSSKNQADFIFTCLIWLQNDGVWKTVCLLKKGETYFGRYWVFHLFFNHCFNLLNLFTEILKLLFNCMKTNF